MEKFVILNPWPAGFCNVLMSYEISLAIAYITGRSVIVPPTNWCVLIDDKLSPKTMWQDIWEVCDKNAAREEFKIYDLLEFEEFSPYMNEMVPESFSYNWISDNLSKFGFDAATLPKINDSPVCLHPLKEGTDQADFDNFLNGRQTYAINEERFLFCTGFGHYWYNVYANGPAGRNEMKRKVNKALDYKTVYYDLASDHTSGVGAFNSIHVRSPWQLNYDDLPDTVNIKDRPDLLLQQVKLLYPNDKPLYVATDIEDRAVFEHLVREYNLFFLDDLGFNPLTPLEKIAMDQIICSRADLFYGSYYSTFSKRINIMRGLRGKQASDHMGFNKICEMPEITGKWPWDNRHWSWHESSHLQWIKE